MTNDAFVGRQSELQALLGLLAASGGGQPATTLLSGEAGVGKSRLLGRFADEAHDRGSLVLRGACIELGGGTIPYAPLVDALRLTVKVHGEDRARELVGPAWEQLGELVTDFTRSRPAADAAAAEASQLRVYGAVLQALEYAGADQPVALIFEDMHWADQSTLDLVAYLTRAKTTEHAMITCSHRTDLALDHPLRRLLAEPDFLRRTEQVRVGRFDEREMGDFLRHRMGPVDGDLVRRGFQLSEGNPFFAEQLMLSGRLTGSEHDLPPSLKDLMLTRLSGLSRTATVVLQVVATAARKADDELLAVVSGLDDEALDEGLNECVKLGMLRLIPEDDSYSVKHALLREAVYKDMQPRRRRTLHNAMAEAIVQESGSAPGDPGLAVELAHHWDRAGRKADALGAWLRAGEMSAAQKAFHEADSHYASALRLWDEVPGPEAAAGRPHERLLAAAADARRWTGHAAQAVDLVERAIGEVDAGADPRRAGELFERLGSYRWEAGAQEESVEAYEHARRLLERAGGRAAVDARVHAALATARLRRGRYLDGLEEAEAAAALAEEVHAEAERGRALNTAGVALAFLGRHEEAESRLQEAKAIAERTEHLEDLLRAYANLGLIREHAGDLPAAIEASLGGLAEAARRGLTGAKQANILANNAGAAMSLLGSWDQAVELLEDVLVEQPPIKETLYLRLTLAEIYARRGRFRDAGQLLEDVRDHANADPRFLGSFYACAAERHLWGGDAARAETTVRRGFEAISGTENDLERLRLCAVGLRAAADRCLEGPDVQLSFDRATVWAGEARKTLAKGTGLAEAKVLGEQCAAELARSRNKDTARQWGAVAQGWDNLGRLYATAYARWREAAAALAARHWDDAREPLVEAADAAERLGAVPLSREVAALRAYADPAGAGSSGGSGGSGGSGASRAPGAAPGASGASGTPADRPAPERVAGLGDLTRREREVLDHLTRGLGNREIARVLEIAEGTVNIHVHRILDKLGVRSRTEAVAKVLRSGSGGPGAEDPHPEI